MATLGLALLVKLELAIGQKAISVLVRCQSLPNRHLHRLHQDQNLRDFQQEPML